MKHLFVIIAALLLLAGAGIYFTQPGIEAPVPVIYWVIDPAPARAEQIRLFHVWQVKNGHCTEHVLKTMADVRAFRNKGWSTELAKAIADATDDGRRAFGDDTTERDLPLRVLVPACEMRLDAASNDLGKKLIQGVSGVAGDCIEAYNGGHQMRYLQATGMLADLTEDAKRLDFGPDKTYAALRPSLFVDGRQYAFPRNPAQNMYWVNKETFAKYRQPLPPSRWTIEEFERRGKAFVEAVCQPQKRQTVFFANTAMRDELRRSKGLSMFNETLTRCTLDDPRNAETMRLIHKWTYEDHILPSSADMESFSAEGGWGQHFQLFKHGRFALYASGRWALMLFRRFGEESGPMKLAVVEPPHDGLPNTVLSGGQTTVYAGSKHLGLAVLFPAYMASEDYNMQIVRDGDALPPNPKYTETELFLRPPDHPNEWGCHEAYRNAARDIAIVQSFSPFVLPVVASRYDGEAISEVMNDRMTAQEAAEMAAQRINDDIERNLAEDADLRTRYDEWTTLQQKIDRHRAEGKRVPVDWIKNPFHRTYYRHRGWLAEPDEIAADE